MPRKILKDKEEEETTGIFDFSDEEDEEKKEKLKNENELSSDNEDHLEEDEDEDEEDERISGSDSDEAPEDVSFHAGKERALTEIRDVISQIKNQKNKKKEKRQKTEELYIAQKKQRLAYLAKRRLPDDVIASLKTPEKKVKVESESESEGEVVGEEEEVVINPRLLEAGSDFLPLDTGVPYARTLRDVAMTEKTSRAELREFRQKMLYGGRIPRQSVKATQAQKAKRKAGKLDRVR